MEFLKIICIDRSLRSKICQLLERKFEKLTLLRKPQMEKGTRPTFYQSIGDKSETLHETPIQFFFINQA